MHVCGLHPQAPLPTEAPGGHPKVRWDTGDPLPRLYSLLLPGGDPLVSAAPSMVAGSWGAGDPVLATSSPQRSRSGEEGVTRGAYGGRNWLWWWLKERRGEVHSSVPQGSPGHSLCARPCSDLPLVPLAGKARSWGSKKSVLPHWLSKRASCPAAAATLGNLVEMQIFRPLLKLTESETLGVEPSNPCFHKASRGF